MDKLKNTFEGKLTNLIEWIKEQQEAMKERDWPNQLDALNDLWINLDKFRKKDLVLRSVFKYVIVYLLR